jgi:hypothetical protein
LATSSAALAFSSAFWRRASSATLSASAFSSALRLGQVLLLERLLLGLALGLGVGGLLELVDALGERVDLLLGLGQVGLGLGGALVGGLLVGLRLVERGLLLGGHAILLGGGGLVALEKVKAHGF